MPIECTFSEAFSVPWPFAANLQGRKRNPNPNFSGGCFTNSLSVFYLQLSFFAYSLLRCFLTTLSHCKQRNSTVALDFPPGPQRCCALNVFFGNLILRFCFRAIVNENRKAVIVEGRLVSSHIPLRPKHWFAINARDFAPVVGHLRFWGSVFVRTSAAATRQQSQQTMSKTCQT